MALSTRTVTVTVTTWSEQAGQCGAAGLGVPACDPLGSLRCPQHQGPAHCSPGVGGDNAAAGNATVSRCNSVQASVGGDQELRSQPSC